MARSWLKSRSRASASPAFFHILLLHICIVCFLFMGHPYFDYVYAMILYYPKSNLFLWPWPFNPIMYYAIT